MAKLSSFLCSPKSCPSFVQLAIAVHSGFHSNDLCLSATLSRSGRVYSCAFLLLLLLSIALLVCWFGRPLSLYAKLFLVPYRTMFCRLFCQGVPNSLCPFSSLNHPLALCHRCPFLDLVRACYQMSFCCVMRSFMYGAPACLGVLLDAEPPLHRPEFEFHD